MAYYRFNRARRYQAGGPAPEQGGGDPMQQILQAAMQAVQSNDSQLAMQVCQILVQLAQGGGQGGPEGGAPAGPEGGAPAGPEAGPEAGAEASGGEPVYRRGGQLMYRVPRRW